MVALNSIKSFSKKAAIVVGTAIVGLYAASAYVLHQYPTFRVEGVSMMPSIQPASQQRTTLIEDAPSRYDTVIVDVTKIDDTYVDHPNGSYIKRVIGMPGDTLAFKKSDGSLLAINNKKITFERNVNFRSFTLTSKRESTKGAAFRSEAFSFSLGGVNFPVYIADQKAFASSNSKTQEYLSEFFRFPWLENHGQKENIYEVTIPKGNYFVLSDNMVAGTDSRHFGPVPKDAITHKVDQH